MTLIAVVMLPERVGLYRGLRRAHSTKLWATTANQMEALKGLRTWDWASPELSSAVYCASGGGIDGCCSFDRTTRHGLLAISVLRSSSFLHSSSVCSQS